MISKVTLDVSYELANVGPDLGIFLFKEPLEINALKQKSYLSCVFGEKGPSGL